MPFVNGVGSFRLEIQKPFKFLFAAKSTGARYPRKNSLTQLSNLYSCIKNNDASNISTCFFIIIVDLNARGHHVFNKKNGLLNGGSNYNRILK